MRFAVLLLAVLSGVPSLALAQAVAHPPPVGCKARPHHPHKGKHPPPQCLAGDVTAVSGTGMKLQPVHGHAVSLLFDDKTVFQTDSGPGTLEGIVPGDFACVTGQPHGHAFTAQVVVFDLVPFSCPAKKPPPQKPPSREKS